jgi:hypothetical protein
MSNEESRQSGRKVELGFEWKNAEHQVEKLCHSRDASAMPRPDLWTDIEDDFYTGRLFPKRFGEPKIESWIIDKNNGGRLKKFDPAKHLVEARTEVAVLSKHIPQTDDGFPSPVEELAVGELLHLRTAGAGELNIRVVLAQGAHQFGAARIAARLAGDEENTKRMSHGHESIEE